MKRRYRKLSARNASPRAVKTAWLPWLYVRLTGPTTPNYMEQDFAKLVARRACTETPRILPPTSCPSMTHRIHHIIQRDPNPQRRILLRVRRIVRVLPRIAQVHIEADGHH